jgi:hypothetical protein
MWSSTTKGVRTPLEDYGFQDQEIAVGADKVMLIPSRLTVFANEELF